jgi:hypothetical protein
MESGFQFRKRLNPVDSCAKTQKDVDKLGTLIHYLSSCLVGKLQPSLNYRSTIAVPIFQQFNICECDRKRSTGLIKSGKRISDIL